MTKNGLLKIYTMLTELNLHRVLVEIDEMSRIGRIYVPDQVRKKQKFLKGTVKEVGSKVEVVKPGDYVSFFNEGVPWDISDAPRPVKRNRIITDYAITYVEKKAGE